MSWATVKCAAFSVGTKKLQHQVRSPRPRQHSEAQRPLHSSAYLDFREVYVLSPLRVLRSIVHVSQQKVKKNQVGLQHTRAWLLMVH